VSACDNIFRRARKHGGTSKQQFGTDAPAHIDAPMSRVDTRAIKTESRRAAASCRMKSPLRTSIRRAPARRIFFNGIKRRTT
jgi:hypothetical protein